MLSDFSGGGQNIYLACGTTDLRKSTNGLPLLVQKSFELDPFSDSLLVFCGKRSDRIKELYWEGDGFVLLYSVYSGEASDAAHERAGTSSRHPIVPLAHGGVNN